MKDRPVRLGQARVEDVVEARRQFETGEILRVNNATGGTGEPLQELLHGFKCQTPILGISGKNPAGFVL